MPIRRFSIELVKPSAYLRSDSLNIAQWNNGIGDSGVTYLPESFAFNGSAGYGIQATTLDDGTIVPVLAQTQDSSQVAYAIDENGLRYPLRAVRLNNGTIAPVLDQAYSVASLAIDLDTGERYPVLSVTLDDGTFAPVLGQTSVGTGDAQCYAVDPTTGYRYQVCATVLDDGSVVPVLAQTYTAGSVGASYTNGLGISYRLLESSTTSCFARNLETGAKYELIATALDDNTIVPTLAQSPAS